MKKGILVLLAAALMITSTGCKSPIRGLREIEDILFVRAVGVDKVDDGKDTVRLTIVGKIPKQGSSNGGGQEASPEVMSANGRTVFEAFRNLRTFIDRKPFYGHTSFFIVGEEAAREDIIKYLDEFFRDYELRMNAKVLVARGVTAEEVLLRANTKDQLIAERLTLLFDNLGAVSFSSEIEMSDLMAMLDNEYCASYVPYVTLVDKIHRKEDGEALDLNIEGYAIFEQAKLLGYISNGVSRGLNWGINKVESGLIVVKDDVGEEVSLHIIDSNSKITPEFEGDRLSVTIKVDMSSNLGEQEGRSNIYDDKSIDFLVKQQNGFIRSEVESAIKFSQENKADIFFIGDAVHHKHPLKWDNIKDKWQENFPDIDINVSVKSKINRTYIIRDPTRRKEDKKK